MAVSLLALAAIFELFDGVQIIATGALRGLGDTHTALTTSLVAYWILGLPLGAYLCFRKGWGAVGIWTGLTLALIFTGVVLLLSWQYRAGRLIEVSSHRAAGPVRSTPNS